MTQDQLQRKLEDMERKYDALESNLYDLSAKINSILNIVKGIAIGIAIGALIFGFLTFKDLMSIAK
jgi:tetrahydromethanopterin S-methyltransferase subunit G